MNVMDLLASAFAPVTPGGAAPPPGAGGVAPAGVPIPRLRPSPVGPLASQAADTGAPRIAMSGRGGRSVAPGEPLSVTPMATDASDPYAGVPRLQPRTGARRFAYDAAAGFAAGDPMATPLSGLADSFLGASNAEQAQTAAERTAQIDENSRRFEREKYQNEQERLKRADAVDAAEKAARIKLLEVQTAAGGFARTGALTTAERLRLRIERENSLNGQYGLTGPNALRDPAERQTAQEAVKREMLSYDRELDSKYGPAGAGGGADAGIDPSEAGDLAIQAGQGAPGTNATGGDQGDAPRMMQRTITRDVKIDENGIEVNGGPSGGKATPKGAIPNNITGDGSLKDPFRVKDAKDPSIKSKIKIGDHFIYLNPKTGKEEIRIRDP